MLSDSSDGWIFRTFAVKREVPNCDSLLLLSDILKIHEISGSIPKGGCFREIKRRLFAGACKINIAYGSKTVLSFILQASVFIEVLKWSPLTS